MGNIGVMLESFHVDGCQGHSDPEHRVFDQSITAACIGWDTAAPPLRELASAVRLRRAACLSRIADQTTRMIPVWPFSPSPPSDQARRSSNSTRSGWCGGSASS